MIKLLNTDGNMAVQAKEANTVAQLRQFVATESAKSFKSFSLHVVSSPPRELKVVLDKKTLAEAGLLNGMITQVVQSAVSGGCVHGRRGRDPGPSDYHTWPGRVPRVLCTTCPCTCREQNSGRCRLVNYGVVIELV